MQRFRQTLTCAVWFVFWLAAADIAVGQGLRWLAQRSPDSGLVRYFDYGRSIEGKLDRMVAEPRDSTDALILEAGWLDPVEWRRLPTKPQPGTDLLISVYGQSFANNAGREAVKRDGHITMRQIGAPAAPPDHSYAATQLDPGFGDADVIVFGILASSVARIGAMSGASVGFEHPAPFTYPHYSLDGGMLQALMPAFTTEQGFRTALEARSTVWQTFKRELAAHDRGYDPLVFDRTPLDASQLVLLMRRGWVAQRQDYNHGVYDGAHGFNPDSQPIIIGKAMLESLGKYARAQGKRLIVLLEQDRGYGDSLERAFGPTLRQAGIDYISTDKLFSSQDPNNFIADGHYTDHANGLLADALRTMIRAPRPAR